MGNRMGRSIGLTVVGIVLTAGATQAQVFTPTFMAPGGASDVGLYLSEGPGDFAIEGIWRRSSGGYDLGFRGGVADLGDLSVLVGGELRNPLALGAPVDVAVTGAAQGVIGDVSGAGFLVGLSVGHTFGAADFALTPYLHPRVGLVNGFGPDDFELELLADFGFDFRISPRLDLRFGIAVDDVGAEWGVGFAWR
ncbi:MAG: hypothetical protein WD737_04250 [Gemmatimonadota bacterium]